MKTSLCLKIARVTRKARKYRYKFHRTPYCALLTLTWNHHPPSAKEPPLIKIPGPKPYTVSARRGCACHRLRIGPLTRQLPLLERINVYIESIALSMCSSAWHSLSWAVRTAAIRFGVKQIRGPTLDHEPSIATILDIMPSRI